MMENYDNEKFVLQTPSQEELKGQRVKNAEVLAALQKTVEKASTLRSENVKNFQEFERKREELSDIVSKMERHSSEGEDETMSDGEEVTEDVVAAQEEELNALTEKRVMLEQKLQAVRGQISQVENDVHNTQRAVNEVRVKTGRKPIDWKESNGDVEYFSVKESVDAEVAEMQDRIGELQSSAEYYEGMRELMEELGGVRLLETKGADGADQGFVLTLMLLGSHILEVTLSKEGSKSELRVKDAKLLTSMSIPVPHPNEEETANLTQTMHSISMSNLSLSKIMSQKPSESVVIRPLQDLVAFSQQLESTHGIRFILSETLARIRTAHSRIEELTLLRSKYAAQVYDIESTGEQEVVCALKEGISIALRLGADCPLVKGSVYISELCGVGGWEEDKLQELKKTVGERRCRGPVEVMEVMVEEIKRRREDEGWALPLTPVLMRTGRD